MSKMSKKIAGAALMACACMYINTVPALAGADLKINVDTIRKAKEAGSYLTVTPGELFIGLGEEGCTLRELEKSMEKYESVEFVLNGKGGTAIDIGPIMMEIELSDNVEYYNDLDYWRGLYTEEQLWNKIDEELYNLRFYPSGGPGGELFDVSISGMYGGGDAQAEASYNNAVAIIERGNGSPSGGWQTASSKFSAKADEVLNSYPAESKWEGSGECHGFAMKLLTSVFGVDNGYREDFCSDFCQEDHGRHNRTGAKTTDIKEGDVVRIAGHSFFVTQIDNRADGTYLKTREAWGSSGNIIKDNEWKIVSDSELSGAPNVWNVRLKLQYIRRIKNRDSHALFQ